MPPSPFNYLPVTCYVCNKVVKIGFRRNILIGNLSKAKINLLDLRIKSCNIISTIVDIFKADFLHKKI